MQRIHLFLASSLVEFAHERKELGDFIRVLNDRYIERGLYFALTLCEDMSKALVQGRKQEEYNEKIRGAQYFYLLFGQEIGVYTLEEFDVALASFRASGAPRIEVFYHEPAQGEAPAQSALDFMRRLDREIGHYFARYSHLDTVKLEMLMELARAPALHSTVTFKDGQAVLDNVPVLSLQNVPLYSQNPAVRRLAAERDRLLAEYDQLTARCRQEPDNMQLQLQRRQVNGQCLELEKQLHQAEADMCELFCTLQEKRSQPGISLWEKEALQRLEEGDYEGAKAILRDDALEDGLRVGLQVADRGKEEIRQYISTKRTLIRTLQATGLDQDSIREIKALYEKLQTLAEEYRVALDVLADYAEFLAAQRDYPQGIAVAERLRMYYQLEGTTPPQEQARLLHLLGMLYSGNKDFARAESFMRDVLALCRRLAETDPAAHETNLANSCNSLAVLLDALNQKKEAEQLYQEALEIWRHLVKENPTYEVYLATSCHNLAVLLNSLNQKEESEQLCREALEIFRRLAKANPAAYEVNLAASCENLAYLLTSCNQKGEAEQLYREALSIRRRLAEANPAAHEVGLAASCNDLAILLTSCNRKEEAEQLYREALEIHRRLVKTNPAAYEADLAQSCFNLANLLFSRNQKGEAERLYREALSIRRRLAEATPAVYEANLADNCYNLAILLNARNQKEEAEQLCREALGIFRRLAKANPAAYEVTLAQCCNGLALLLDDLNQKEEAEQLYREALGIYRRLAKANPAAYEVTLAQCCNDLALLLDDLNQKKEAEQLFREELGIRRRLAKANPATYEVDLACSCYILATFLSSRNQKKEAGRLLREAREIFYRLLAEEDAR